MKQFLYGLLLILIAVIPLRAEEKKLPDINSLKELPVSLVMDTTENEDYAASSIPKISKDGTVVFFDIKHQQLFITKIGGSELIPVSRRGDGPREYRPYIRGIVIENDLFYVIDEIGKVICFTLKGEFKWEMVTRKEWNFLIGKRGDTFYINDVQLIPKGQCKVILNEWKKGGVLHPLMSSPMIVLVTAAIIEGKVINNAGVIPCAYPVHMLCEDSIWATRSEHYRIDFLDLKGKLKKTVSFNEAIPEIPSKDLIITKNYAIMDMYYNPPYVYVTSNYYKNGKPRVDLFTRDGKLAKSFLIPVEANTSNGIFGRGKSKTVSISGNYLIYTDHDESGFKIYRINL